MASRSPATIFDVRDDLAMSDDDCPMEDSLNSSIKSPSPAVTTTRHREAISDQGSAGKRRRPSSPDNYDTERDPKRTMLSPPPPPSTPSDDYTTASFLLRSTQGSRIFAIPKKVSLALMHSPLGKYLLEGETRPLGNGSVLVVAVWKHNLPRTPDLMKPTFTLGEWEVICRRADKEAEVYNYAKVGPLNDENTLDELWHDYRSLDGEVLEMSWIPQRLLPRTSTGKWLRLKVRGPIPTRITISGLVYFPRPYILPLLRCPKCLKIGHSVVTCRAQERCTRCSGPHPFRTPDYTCTRPYHCFQCRGSHGPRSVHCPHNKQAQDLYTSQVRDGKSLQHINQLLRDLPLPNLQPQHRTQSTSPPATIIRPRQRNVQSDLSYSTIITANRFTALQDPEKEKMADTVATPVPVSTNPAVPSATNTNYCHCYSPTWTAFINCRFHF